MNREDEENLKGFTPPHSTNTTAGNFGASFNSSQKNSAGQETAPNGAGFISLAKASQITGYHQDYLGFLCRSGKLKGMKIGRNWVTTQSNLDEFLKNYKNGINEVMDQETGQKIQVHVEPAGRQVGEPEVGASELPKLLDPHVLEQKTDVGGQYAGAPVSLEVPVETAPELPQQSLQHLKKEVFESLEERIEKISSKLQEAEAKAESQKNQAPVVWPVSAMPVERPNLLNKFSSNIAFTDLQSTDAEMGKDYTDGKNASIGKEKIKQLYKSFILPQPSNLPMVFASLAIVLLGTVATMLWNNFATQKELVLHPKETKIVYQGNRNQESVRQLADKNQEAVGNQIVINRQGGTTIINKLLGFDQSQLYSAIDARLNQYLSEGKFLGPQGPQGPAGQPGGSGTASYLQPNPGAGFGGGSLAGFTFLSADDFTTRKLRAAGDATIGGALNVSGATSLTTLTATGESALATTTISALTVSGTSTFNGSTTIANLTVTSFNPGFTQGSVAFQGASGLAQDNGNFYWDDANNRLGVGTGTPLATLAVQGSPSSTPLIISSSTGAALFTITSAGNVGVNTSTPGYTLTVAGTSLFTGDLTARGNFYLSGSSTTTGNSVILGTLNVASASTMATTTIAELTITNNATFNTTNTTGTTTTANLSVSGTSNLATTTITRLTISGNATTTGNQNIGGALNVTATTTLNALTAGQATLGNASTSALTVNGAAVLAGAASLQSTLSVTGHTTFTTASGTALTLSGALAANTFNGNAISQGTGTLTLNNNTLTVQGGNTMLVGSNTITGSSISTSTISQITLNGNGNTLSLFGNSNINQDLMTTSTPAFAGLTINGALFATNASTTALTVSGPLWATGQTTLATSTISNLTVTNTSTLNAILASGAVNFTGQTVLATATIASLTVTGSSTVSSLNQALPVRSTAAGSLYNGSIGLGGGDVSGILTLNKGGLGFDASAVAKGGLITGTGAGTMGIQAVGSDGLCLVASSTTASGIAWTSCAQASGAITSLNGLTAASQTFATGTDTNIGLTITSSGSVHTYTPTWAGTLAAGRLNSNVVQAITNDANITGGISAQNLTLGWTGQLSVSRGGTGQSTLTSNALLLGNGTGAISTTTVGTNGQFLVGVTSSAPTFVTMSGDASINNAGVLTLANVNSAVGTFGASNQTITATVNSKGLITNISTSTIALDASQITSGTIGYSRGGTGQTNYTANGIIYAGASALQSTSAGTAYQVLTSNGSSAAPSYSDISSLLTAGSNISITGTSTVAVSSTPNFTSITTTNASTTNLTVSNNAYLTNVIINGDTLTDLTGTGLTVSGNALSLANTSVTAGTYGSAASTTVFTVDAQGRFTAASSQDIAINASQITSGILPVARGGTGSSSLNTTLVAEGTNLYYTDSRARSAVSSSATGLTYTSGTGIFSLTSGYNIPLTASTTQWNNLYNSPITYFNAGNNIVLSGTSTIGTSLTPTFTTVNTGQGAYELYAMNQNVQSTDAVQFATTTLTGAIIIGGDTLTELVGTGLQVSGAQLQTTLGTSVDLTSEVTGILPIANGGTNSSTLGSTLVGFVSNDTNVTGSIANNTLTLGWTGTLADGRIASASNWNSVYNNVLSRLAVATGTAGNIFNISTSTNSLIINLPIASASNTGQLSSTDWSTFNSKQAAGNYITALTGDVTAAGPGSVAATLATVNSNVGTFGAANQFIQMTVNGKGLITAVSTSTIAIAGSQITSGTVAPTYGGLGFNASTIAKGGLITGTGSGTFGIQTVGTDGLCLTASSTTASGVAWTSCSTASGAITSLNGLITSSQTFATGTATGIGLTITSSGSVHTFTPTVSSGYVIPLSASTTEWSNFYATPSTRITAGTNMSWSGNILNGLATSTIYTMFSGTSPITYNNTTGAIGIQQANLSQNGYLSSTDWGTFNNKLSGSLTSGYIVKATGASTTANSVIYDDGTNIGIGTTTPAVGLSIQGAAAYGLTHLVSSASNGEASIQFKSSDDTDDTSWVVGKNIALTGDQFSVWRGSNKLVIDTTGNVGIGTTTPGSRLDLGQVANGTNGINIQDGPNYASNVFQYTRIDGIPMINMGRSTTGTGQITIYGTSAGSYNKLSSDGGLNIDNGATAKFRLAPSGNDLYYQNTNTSGSVYFTGASGADLTGDFNFRNTGIINFGTAGSERIKILANGNVGIGTTSPLAKLDVYGNLNVATGSTPALFVNTATTRVGIGNSSPARPLEVTAVGNLPAARFTYTSGSAGIEIMGNSLSSDYIHFGDSAGNTDNGYISFSNTSSVTNPNSLLFGTSQTTRMIITSTGNVGIGTTSPTAKLEVYTTGTTPVIIRSLANSAPGETNDIIHGKLRDYDINTFNLQSVVESSASNNYGVGLYTYAGNVAKLGLYQNNQGNVGIGTTNPTSLLSVESGNPDTSLRLTSSGAGGKSYTLSASNAASGIPSGFNIYDQTAGAARLVINSTGNVGIGTTGPQSLLHVAGNVPTINLQHTGSNPGMFSIRTSYGGSNGTTPVVRFGSDVASDAVSSLVIQNGGPGNVIMNGNVGIGTTSPVQKLELLGQNGLPAVIGTTQNGNFRIGSATNNVLDFGNTAGSPVWGSWIQSVDRSMLNVNYPLLLNPNGGNVGIGTNNPLYKLEVAGTASATTLTLANALAPTYGGLGFNASTVAKGGLITGTGAGTFGIQTVGSDGLCLTASSTTASGVAWTSCSTASGAITSLNGLTTSSQTFATGTATGIGLTITSSGSVHTFTPTVSSGYNIPLTASTTNWNTAYNTVNASSTFWDSAYTNRITSATAPLQISSNNIGLQAGYNIPLTASTTNWNGFYDVPSTRITAGTNMSWSGNTLNGLATTTIYTMFSGTSPITYNNTTGAIGIQQANLSQNGYLSSTDWGTFNNKLSGSLTSGYIVKATGASTTANSVIYDDGTNIGIGTTTPAVGLSIQGAAAYGLTHLVSSASNGEASIQFKSSDDTDDTSWVVGKNIALTGDQFSVWRGSNKLVIDTTGNVGIGTTSPGAKLDVQNGTVSQVAAKIWHTGNSANAGYGLQVSNGYPAAQGSGAFEVFGVYGNNFGTEYLAVKDNGNVGIGTTSPGEKLTVKGNVGILDNSPIRLYNAGGTANGGIRNHTTNYTQIFGINGTQIMNSTLATALVTVLENGNVGIGTTSPGEKLQVNGNITVLQTDATEKYIGFSTPNSPSYAGTRIGSYHTANWGGDLRFYTLPAAGSGSGFERMRIDNTGNVGIGTTSPAANLHLFTTDSTVVGHELLRLDNTSANATNNGTSIGFYQGGTEMGKIDSHYTTSDAKWGLYLGGGNNLSTMVLKDGNVGVGTIDPTLNGGVSSKFTIVTGAGATVFAAATSTTGKGFAFNNGTNGGLLIYDGGTSGSSWTAGISQLGGNVGIGTSSPFANLSVAGSAGQTTSIFAISTSTAGFSTSTAFVVDSNGNVGLGTAAPTSKFVVNGASSGTLQPTVRIQDNNGSTGAMFTLEYLSGGSDAKIRSFRATNGGLTIGRLNDTLTTETSILNMDSSNNIQIGSAGTGIKLDIGVSSQATNYDGIRIYDSTGSGSSRSGLTWYNTGGSANTGRISMQVGGGYIANQMFFEVGDTSKVLQTRMLIDQNGNVGIGTTSPQVALHVQRDTSPGGSPTAGIGLLRLSNYAGWGSSRIEFETGRGIMGTIDQIDSGTGSDLAFFNRTNAGSLSEKVRINSVGNVGIGTTSPGAKLVVSSGDTTASSLHILGADYKPLFIQGSDTSLAAIRMQNTSNVGGTIWRIGVTGSAGYIGTAANTFSIGDESNNVRLAITSTGNVGIGTTSPVAKLAVNGSVAFPALANDSTGYYVCLNTTTGQMATSTTACGGSSLRFKKNVNPLNYGLAEIEQLRAVSYNWRESFMPNNQTSQVGFIAEDVAKIIPEIVSFDVLGRPSNVDYGKLTPILVNAIQQQQKQINEVKTAFENYASSTTELLSNNEIKIEITNAKIADLESDIVATTTETGDGKLTLLGRVMAYLKGVGVEIGNEFTKITKLFVGSLHIEGEVCVDDVCVTKEQFKNLIRSAPEVAGVATQATSTNSAVGGGPTNTGATTTTVENIATSTPPVENNISPTVEEIIASSTPTSVESGTASDPATSASGSPVVENPVSTEPAPAEIISPPIEPVVEIVPVVESGTVSDPTTSGAGQ